MVSTPAILLSWTSSKALDSMSFTDKRQRQKQGWPVECMMSNTNSRAPSGDDTGQALRPNLDSIPKGGKQACSLFLHLL